MRLYQECLFRITFIRKISYRRLALLQLALTHFSLRFLGRSHRVIMQKYDRLTWHTPFCWWLDMDLVAASCKEGYPAVDPTRFSTLYICNGPKISKTFFLTSILPKYKSKNLAIKWMDQKSALIEGHLLQENSLFFDLTNLKPLGQMSNNLFRVLK